MTRPKRIEVIRRGFRYRVLVDGEPLPYSMSRDTPPVVTVDPDGVPTVTLTFMADQIDVTNQLFDEGGEGDGEARPYDGEDHRH